MFVATSTTATSTFAGNVTVSGTTQIGTLSGLLRAINGIITTTFINLSSDVSGILSITNGGTGITTPPALGQILVGNSSGGYTLTSTSSLGISGTAASSTLLSDSDTFSGITSFTNNVTLASATATSFFSTVASSTNLFAQTASLGSLSGTAFSSLASNYLPKWSGGIWSNSLIYDTGTAIGIGTTSPSANLAVQGNAYVSGNVSGFVHDQGGAVYDVKAYGAKGDGSTDDTAAIQAALDAANAAGGGTVLLPAGTFITRTLTLYSKITIKGAGTDATVLRLKNNTNADVIKGANFDSLTTTNSLSGIYGWALRDFSIDGNNANNLSAGAGVRVYGYEFSVDGVSIYSTREDGWYSEWAQGSLSAPIPNSMESYVRNFKVHDSASDGIVWAGPHDSVWSDVFAYQNNGKGVWFKPGSDGTTVVNGHSYAHQQTYAWYIEATNIQLNGTVGETASIANLFIGSNTVTITGGMYYTQPSALPSNGCIQIGDVSHPTITHINIDTITQDCTTGAINFYSNAAYSDINLLAYATSGPAYIGTPSPTTHFEIYGHGGANLVKYQFPTSDFSVGGTAFTISSSTNFLGIGTSSPWTNLVIQGAGSGSAAIGAWPGNNMYSSVYLNGSQASGDFNFMSSPGDTSLYINRPVGQMIKFREGNGPNQLTLFSGGNISIGTSTSYAKLYINANNGELNRTLFAIGSSTNASFTTLFSIDNTGSTTAANGFNITAGCFAINNVCFSSGASLAAANTWTLLQQFQNGASTTNLSVYNNAYFGTAAISNFDSFGNLNLAATAALKQVGNTILYGSSTLSSIFVGQGAGSGVISNATSSSVTSGPFSTALGFQALGNATSSAYQSVAIGYQALQSSATISNSNGGNTAVGYSALRTNTIGSASVAIGIDALQVNTAGGSDVAIGAFALNANTTGASNVAVGRDALLNTQIGVNNVAVGRQAGAGSVGNSFSNNSLFGHQSGFLLTTGGQNLFFGNYTASTTQTGSNNIALGYDVALPITNGSNQLNIGNLIFGTGINGEGMSISTGNIGIGTTSPYSKFEVWGPDTASTTAFSVVNNASTTVFASYDNGNATYSGSLFQSSDQRLKTNISSLDASSSLSLVDQLNPVSYTRIDQPDQGTTLGFIAQEVQKLFPNLVSTTSPTTLTPGGTLTLNYTGLIAPLVAAVQALSNQFASLAQAITTHLLNADRINTNELCVGTTCVNQQQLAALLASANSSSGNSGTGTSAADSGASSTAPVIEVNGNNPAMVKVGTAYDDLGATITGPTADLHLGIATYLNGVLMSPLSVDTSQAATDTIDYVATDQNGLTSTSTRTVIVQAQAQVQAPQTQAASSSEAVTPPISVQASSTDATNTGQQK